MLNGVSWHKQFNEELIKYNEQVLINKTQGAEILSLDNNQTTLLDKINDFSVLLNDTENALNLAKNNYDSLKKRCLLQGTYDYVEGHNLIEKAILNENFEEKEYKKVSGRMVPNHTQYFDLDPRIMINPKHDVILRDTAKLITEKYIRDINNRTSIVRGVMDFLLTEGYQYVGDQKNFDCVEFWEFPYEYIPLKMGDCEDSSVFCSNILWLLGVPNAVVTGTYSNAGGHAYVFFLDDSNVIKILETTAFDSETFIFDLTTDMKTNWYKARTCFTFMKTYQIKTGV